MLCENTLCSVFAFKKIFVHFWLLQVIYGIHISSYYNLPLRWVHYVALVSVGSCTFLGQIDHMLVEGFSCRLRKVTNQWNIVTGVEKTSRPQSCGALVFRQERPNNEAHDNSPLEPSYKWGQVPTQPSVYRDDERQVLRVWKRPERKKNLGFLP